MKTVLFIFITGISFLLFPDTEKKITAKIANIEYYSKGICNDTSLVYVRVLYDVKGEKPEKLRMKHDFFNGMTSTMPVTEIDKNGNFVYGFCLGHTDTKEFSTVFISVDGKLSNKLFVKIDVSDADIISGTAPYTLKCKN